MRILLVTARSDRGGGPQHLWDLLIGIRTRRPDWKIGVASPLTEPFGPLFKRHSDFFFELPERAITPQVAFLFSSFLLKEQITVLHSHGFGAGLYGRIPRLPTFPAGLAKPLKRVHTFHGLHTPEAISAQIKIGIDRWLAPHTDLLICVSHSERSQAEKLNIGRNSRFCVISNGIDLSLFNKDQERRPFYREKRGFTENDFVLGSLGRLDPIKNFDFLIRTLAFEGAKLREQLKKQNKNLKLVIAGNGEEKETLARIIEGLQAQEWISILENEHEPSVFLNSLDLYISASKSEAQGIAVMEAMATGLPVLVSKVNGHIDLIEEGKSGLFFDLTKPETLTQEMESVIFDPEKAKQLGTSARRFAEEHFSRDKMVDQVILAYESLKTS